MTLLASGPTEMGVYRMKMILIGLRAEAHGMRLTRKAPSCYSIAKKEFGLKGDRAKVTAQFRKLYEDAVAALPVREGRFAP